MVHCYILWSEKAANYYVGVCQEDLQGRITKHNNKSYGNKSFTSVADDWTLVYAIECDSFAQAVGIERHIKRMKSTKYIQNLVKYPEMSVKLKDRYEVRASDSPDSYRD